MIVVIWFASGLLSAIVASGKGRSGLGWFFLGLLFGPLGFVASIVVGDLKAVKAAENLALEKSKLVKCPHCAEFIQPEARKCRYCHEPIAQVDRFLNKNNDRR